MYGSPGPTSHAQYPIGSLTWFSLFQRGDQHAPQYRRGREGDPAYPAAAIASKSASVIQVSQWSLSVCCAVPLSCNCPNVHSSTMFAFPVLSNRLGVIQGCASKRASARTCKGMK